MMNCHSHTESVSNQRDIIEETRYFHVADMHLQDILLMFLDLGLTPSEMSKTSGFPLAVIVMGLKQLNEVSPVPVCPSCGKNQFSDG